MKVDRKKQAADGFKVMSGLRCVLRTSLKHATDTVSSIITAYILRSCFVLCYLALRMTILCYQKQNVI